MRLRHRQDRTCPYCSLTWSVGLVVVESGDGLPPEMQGAAVVVHEEPRCANFEAMPSDEFVRRADRSVVTQARRN